MTTMIALVGEQPLPVLLPALALGTKLKRLALVHTSATADVAARIARLDKLKGVVIEPLTVKPFDVRHCQHEVKRWLKNVPGPFVYNLTGGTKTMILAAYMVAVANKSSVQYLQTDKGVSRLYSYRVGSSGLVETETRELPALIDAADYLNAHLPGFTEHGFSRDKQGLSSGGAFEKAVYDALTGHVDQVLAGVRPQAVADNIDIDLFIRCGNQAGIAELKAGKADKDGIDQLSTAGGRAYLGIYTAKFLITGRPLGDSLKQLAKALGIVVVELPSYSAGNQMSHADRKLLVETIKRKLGAV